jgi:uncharacterized protein
MSDKSSTARRYHWHSSELKSFIEEPHTSIYGKNKGKILNMVDKGASGSRNAVLEMSREKPELLLKEISKLFMPSHHDVRTEDVDMKRLGAMLWLAHERRPADFEELLLLEGLGPRTLQSLALVSEVIYGTPSRFTDPARFSFAHGGKDGHPFPVPLKVYDETIITLQHAIQKAKLGSDEKKQAIKKLSELSREAEKGFTPKEDLQKLIEKERTDSWKYGGRTVFGKAKPPLNRQLPLL